MFDHEQHTSRPFLTSEDDFRQLRKSKDFYEHMVENSLGLIFAHDLSGRLLSVNAEAARVLEYSVDELLGANIYELFHPRVRRLFTPYLHRIAKHGEDRGELRLIKRPGGVVAWSYRNVLYSDPGFPPMIIGHALDITGHLQLEHRLEERT